MDYWSVLRSNGDAVRQNRDVNITIPVATLDGHGQFSGLTQVYVQVNHWGFDNDDDDAGVRHVMFHQVDGLFDVEIPVWASSDADFVERIASIVSGFCIRIPTVFSSGEWRKPCYNCSKLMEREEIPFWSELGDPLCDECGVSMKS